MCPLGLASEIFFADLQSSPLATASMAAQRALLMTGPPSNLASLQAGHLATLLVQFRQKVCPFLQCLPQCPRNEDGKPFIPLTLEVLLAQFESVNLTLRKC